MTPQVKGLRVKAGQYIKSCRIAADLTQAQVMKEVGAERAVVSMIESGVQRIPSDRIGTWAVVLKRDPKEFAKNLLKYYDNHFYKLLFDSKED